MKQVNRDSRFKWDHDKAYRTRTRAVGAALVRGDRSAAAKAAAEAVEVAAEAAAEAPSTWAAVDEIINRGA